MSGWRLLVRRGSVILLLVWLAVLTASFIQRQLATQPEVEDTLQAEPTSSSGERALRVQRGVEYSSTFGPDVSFRVAAAEAVEYEGGWAEVSGMQVSFYSEGQVAYGLATDRGRFNATEKVVETLGQTLLSLRGGVAIQADGFVLEGKEGLVESKGAVVMAGPGWGGVASQARANLGNDVLDLVGGVSISFRSGSGSVLLLTPHVRYERRHALLAFPEGLEIRHQGVAVQARGGRLQLVSAEGEPRRLELAAPVRVAGVLSDGSPFAGEAGDTTVERLPDGRFQLAAAALPVPGWVWVRWLDAVAGWQELTAWRVVGEGSAGAWEWLEGQGQTCGAQTEANGSRRIEAERLRVSLAGGRPTTASAFNQVRLEAASQWVTGGQLESALTSDAFTMTPAAGQRVLLGAPEVEAWCDRLEGGADRTVTASGKVGGALRRDAGPGKEAPVRFAADTAVMPPGGKTVILTGDARIWQGDQLVRATRLEYETGTEVVRGQGEVLTRAPIADGTELVVRSRFLTYDRTSGEAVYEGDVVVEDPRGRARCGKLVARMDAGGRVESIELDGGVTLSETATGRVLSGQRGRLAVAEDLFEMWGSPVLVRETDGNQMKGDRLAWRRRTGSVVVTGGEDTPTETLYHPTQQGTTPVPTRRRP